MVTRSTPSITDTEGVFTIYASVEIEQSAQDTFQKILDFRNYGEWNSFTPVAEVKRLKENDGFSAGDELTLHAHIAGTCGKQCIGNVV